MKKIGIVGGIAWLSTVDYYAALCRRGEELHLANNLPGAPSTPEICIESPDLNKAASYIGIDGNEASWSRFDEYHRVALQRLEASDADVVWQSSISLSASCLGNAATTSSRKSETGRK
jgi:aspartate racemase